MYKYDMMRYRFHVWFIAMVSIYIGRYKFLLIDLNNDKCGRVRGEARSNLRTYRYQCASYDHGRRIFSF